MRKSIVHKHICRTALLISSLLGASLLTTPVMADTSDDEPEFTVTNSEDITNDKLNNNGRDIDHKTQDTLVKPKKKKQAKKKKAKTKVETEAEEVSDADYNPPISMQALYFDPVSLNTTASVTKRLNYAVTLAEKLSKMGIPYVWGGNSIVSGVDCSGLTVYLYSHIGIGLPRTAAEQAGALNTIPLEQAIPGDLLFWGMPGNEYHVGIYIGNNQFIAAPAPGQTVSVQNISGAFYPSHAGTIREIKK